MGVPIVIVAGPDNPAVGLVEEGVNGFVAPSAEPGALADSIIAVAEGGPALRESTADWFTSHAHELSLGASLTRVLATYDRSAGGGRPRRLRPRWLPR